MDGLTIMLVLVEVLAMALIASIQTFFYYKTVGLSVKWRGGRLVLIMLAFSVLGAALELISLNTPALIGIATEGALLALMVLYPVLFMGGRRMERAFFGMVNCAVYLFSGLLGGLALNGAIKVLPHIRATSTFFEVHIIRGPYWQVLLLALLLVIAIYVVLVLVITRLSTEGKRFMPPRYWMGMMIGFAVVVAGLGVLSNLSAWVQNAQQLSLSVAIGSLSFLIVWLLLYFVFYFICRYFSKAAETNMLALQNDLIERYVVRKQASDERIKVLSHDLKHSLAQWRALAEEKGDWSALQDIAEYEGQLRDSLLVQVENESANALINQKAWEADQIDVAFLAEGAFYEDLLVSKLDLCSLLGNLLDNALEAARQAEAEDLRRVRLLIRRQGNLLILVVENGYQFEPVIENGNFATRKEDKDRHAIGMLSIRSVAEKYAGAVSTSYENHWFKATVMLCGYKETNPNALSSEN